MPDKNYWRKRMENIEKMSHDKGMEYARNIDEQFRRAQAGIDKELRYWYSRLAENNEINLSDARRLLDDNQLPEFRWNVNQYIKYGKENAVNEKWMTELENASAKVHIRRLDALKLQMQQQCEVLYGNMLDGLEGTLKDIYTNTYYHTAYEFQKGFNTGWAFNELDNRRIEKAINVCWTNDGKNFSDRVWDNKTKLVNELNTVLTQSIIRGEAPQKAIDLLSKRMKISKFNAGRLIMTESSAIYSVSQEECYKDLGVEEYEFVATLDSHTSDVCQVMDGQHFKMSEYEIGVNAPPLHCFCRSCTVPYFDDEFSQQGKRIARDEAGKSYYVPGNMKYTEWKNKFVKSGEKTAGANAGFAGGNVFYNDKAEYLINIPDYSDAINTQLSASASKVAKFGSDNMYEYAAIVDLNTGEEVHFGTSEEFSSVNSYYKFLKENLDGKFAMVHNHNTSSSLSLPDMQELCSWNNIDSVSAVTNDGLTYAVKSNGVKSNEYLYLKYKEEHEELANITNEYELEKKMVEYAVDDFSKGGVIIFDGRKK